jgi:hypothetical protein
MCCQFWPAKYYVGTMTEKLLRDKLGYRTGQAVLLLDLPEGIANPFEGVEHVAAQAKKAKSGKRKLSRRSR